ncbi:hypothetical protein C2S53_011626 [Perilla frutescens var. hirtella]|uniref:Cotton fiber protein n=1 Tax=Perilla frutescens var. hirtella TaxID=608512 RepID=A0AAD4P1D3_PERFH|nr:hypothetical protein C2S53_011626 [Perilla frutescens var. hirtella]
MANKNSALVQKISALVKIYLLLAKLRKPVIRKLMFLKKMKNLKLLQQYSSHYSYVKEYEFSPSSTPLIQFRRMSKNGRVSFKKLYSNLLLICSCSLGCRKKEVYRLEMREESAAVAGEMMAELSSSWSDDDTVDERAERFIQSFYEEMRRQRNESTFQLLLEI